MAELIKRSTVIDVLKETGIIQDNDLGHLVVDEIERIEATTEAEIRNKAISEFSEKLKHEIQNCSWQFSRLEEKTIDEMAEQLKGE